MSAARVDLPAPEGPTSATRDPRLDPQRDAAERRPVLGVGERDVLDLDRAAGARSTVGAGAILEDLVGGEQLGDLVGARQRLRRLAGLAGDVLERAVELARVGREHHQVAGRERPGRDPEDAHHDHQGGADRRHDAHRAVEARLQPRELHPEVHPGLAQALDAPVLEALGAERLHDAHRRQRLARCGRDHALVAALGPRRGAQLAAVAEAEHGEHRGRRERHQRQDRVDHDAHDHDPDQQHHGLDYRPERVREHRADRVDVGRHPGHQVALLAPLVKASESRCRWA